MSPVLPVLIDTSVWIDYFSPRPKISQKTLSHLRHFILNDEALIIDPIRAELLSGQIRLSKHSELDRLLSSLTQIDLNWSLRETWDSLVKLASDGISNRVPVPGLIDRMILLSASRANVAICSLDQNLLRFARFLKINIYPL